VKYLYTHDIIGITGSHLHRVYYCNINIKTCYLKKKKWIICAQRYRRTSFNCQSVAVDSNPIVVKYLISNYIGTIKISHKFWAVITRQFNSLVCILLCYCKSLTTVVTAFLMLRRARGRWKPTRRGRWWPSSSLTGSLRIYIYICVHIVPTVRRVKRREGNFFFLKAQVSSPPWPRATAAGII